MKITKTAITMIVLIVWAVFSIAYITWSGVNNFKLNQLKNAANQGYAQGIIDVGTAAQKCQEVPLNIGNNTTVNIVSVDCLKQNSAQATTPATTNTTPKK